MAAPKSGEKMPQEQQETAQAPKRGDRGEYLPATYTTSRGNVREDR